MSPRVLAPASANHTPPFANILYGSQGLWAATGSSVRYRPPALEVAQRLLKGAEVDAKFAALLVIQEEVAGPPRRARCRRRSFTPTMSPCPFTTGLREFPPMANELSFDVDAVQRSGQG